MLAQWNVHTERGNGQSTGHFNLMCQILDRPPTRANLTEPARSGYGRGQCPVPYVGKASLDNGIAAAQ